MTKNNDLNWRIGGEAGFGILNAGLMFARTAARSGLHCITCSEYPSLIRGGHNTLDVRVTGDKMTSHANEVSLLVALNKDTVDLHHTDIDKNGGLIYDPDDFELDRSSLRPDIKVFPVPLTKIADESGNKILRNVVSMAASFALLGFEMEVFKNVISETFKRKGDEIIGMNLKALDITVKYCSENFKEGFEYQMRKVSDTRRMILNGNEAIAAGAIKAGCKFISAYPMTPSTSIMETMAKYEKRYGIVVKHTEDELASMAVAIGASYTGVRSMTSTSGGGFCLMAENLGLAAVTETPLVAVEVMRPGPGTGMATHTGQGDLRFLLHLSTDEAPRVLVALSDRKDAFYLTFEAFNVADRFQIPVILVSDKYLASSQSTEDDFECNHLKIDRGLARIEDDKIGAGYLRYRFTDSGISPRAIPGQIGGMHVASSYEHDEHGSECEDEENRIRMHKKRFAKFEVLKKELPAPRLIGDTDAPLTVITWGTTKGAVMEARDRLEKQGIKTNQLHITYISPFHHEAVAEILHKAKKVVIVEGNYTSLLASVIREQTGFWIEHRINRYDGRPFDPTVLTGQLKELV